MMTRNWILLLCVLGLGQPWSVQCAYSGAGTSLTSENLQLALAGNDSSNNATKIYCKNVHNHEESERCSFIGNTSDCEIAGGFIQYLDLPYCQLAGRWQPAAMVVLFLWLFYLFLAIGVTVEHFLCPALSVISNTLGLSESVAGVTFLAFGNGAADIFSIFVLITTGDGDLVRAETAMGAIFGGGLFVTTVVVGLITFQYPIHVKMSTFLRDVAFYAAAICWLINMLADGRISQYEALGFIILYVAYVTTVIVMLKVSQRLESRVTDGERTPLLGSRSGGSSGSRTPREYRSGDRTPSQPESPGERPVVDDKSLSDAYVHFTGSIGGGSVAWQMASDGSMAPPAEEGTNSQGTDTVVGAAGGQEEVSAADKPANSAAASASTSPARRKDKDSRNNTGNRLRSSPSLISPATAEQTALDDTLTDNERSRRGKYLLSSESGEFVTTGDSLLHQSSMLFVPDPPMKKLLKDLWPYTTSDWKASSWFGRIMLVLRLPLRLVLTVTVPVVQPTTGAEEAEKAWNKYLIALNCLVAPVFATLALDVFFHELGSGVLVFAGILATAVGVALFVVTVIFTRFDHPPRAKSLFAFLGFLISVTWIYLIANEVVNILDTVGVVLELNGAFLGLTILAGGNSVCDLVANFLVAKSGKAEMAVAACYGSPLLNMLIGVGLSACVVTFRDGEHYILSYTTQLKVASGVLLGGLLWATGYLVVTTRTVGWKAGRFFAVPLFCSYLAFLAAVIALEFGVSDG